MNARAEIQQGERFQFGRNWSTFLRNVNEQVIERAERSLVEFLELDDLHGRSLALVDRHSALEPTRAGACAFRRTAAAFTLSSPRTVGFPTTTPL